MVQGSQFLTGACTSPATIREPGPLPAPLTPSPWPPGPCRPQSRTGAWIMATGNTGGLGGASSACCTPRV